VGDDGADWYKFTLGSPYTMTASTAYFVQVARSGALDAVNYYAWPGDAAAGWAGGTPVLWNGGAWVAFPVSMDLAFIVLGYDDNGEVIKRICDPVSGCGQFLADIRFEPGTTGVIAPIYRDGSYRGQEEIEELLRVGTSAGARLLANVDPQRVARVYIQPVAPAPGWSGLVIGPQGELVRGDGSALLVSEQPAGQWARMGELATAGVMHNFSGAVFVESCSWDGKVLRMA
jgi:hypothetical protein